MNQSKDMDDKDSHVLVIRDELGEPFSLNA